MKRLLQTQESVNPYQSVLVPGNGTEHPVSRAIYNNDAAAADFEITFADGTSDTVKILGLTAVPFAVKKVTTAGNLLFLY